MTSDAARSHDRAERRLDVFDRWASGLRVATVALVVVLIMMVAWLGYRLDQNDQALGRQDCIARVNGGFFGHLADALAREPASVNRQTFIDRMKDDAALLAHLDETCPK